MFCRYSYIHIFDRKMLKKTLKTIVLSFRSGPLKNMKFLNKFIFPPMPEMFMFRAQTRTQTHGFNAANSKQKLSISFD